MAWYEITEAEIAPRQPLDYDLFNKIRSNLNIGIAALNAPRVIPNGSFEHTTGALPHLWTITTYATSAGGAASISTVSAHGAYSLKLTKSVANGRVEAYTDDYIAVASTSITIHGILWATGATNTAITGGVSIRTFSRDQTVLSTVHYNHSSYTNAPATYSMACTMSSDTRFVKVGCLMATDSTVLGSLHFDGLYIMDT